MKPPREQVDVIEKTSHLDLKNRKKSESLVIKNNELKDQTLKQYTMIEILKNNIEQLNIGVHIKNFFSLFIFNFLYKKNSLNLFFLIIFFSF